MSVPTSRTTPEKFYIEACDDGSVDVLAIDRVSTEMTLTGESTLQACTHTHTITAGCWSLNVWIQIPAEPCSSSVLLSVAV